MDTGIPHTNSYWAWNSSPPVGFFRLIDTWKLGFRRIIVISSTSVKLQILRFAHVSFRFVNSSFTWHVQIGNRPLKQYCDLWHWILPKQAQPAVTWSDSVGCSKWAHKRQPKHNPDNIRSALRYHNENRWTRRPIAHGKGFQTKSQEPPGLHTV